MSEDMLGAHSVSLMVSTSSVTHKKNWLLKQLFSAKKPSCVEEASALLSSQALKGQVSYPQHHL